MDTNRTGLTVFWVFVLYMVVMSFVVSWWVVPTYRDLTPAQIQETVLVGNTFVRLLWGFSIPVGSVLACVGLLIYTRTRGIHIWLFGVGITILLSGIGFLPISGYFPAVFGIGGGLILTLFLLTLWFWTKKHSSLEGPAKTASILQLAGYVFFLVAMWYICGLLGPPVYLLNTDKVAEFGSLPKGHAEAVKVLIYFILGWLFLFFSHYKSHKIDVTDNRAK